MKQVVWENDCAQKFIKTILLPIIYFIYFAIINPSLHGIQFTKRRFVLTWVFFWFPVIVWKEKCVYFTFLAVLISFTLCMVVFPSCSRALQYSSLREKGCWKETKSTVTAIRIHAEISWFFYENWTWHGGFPQFSLAQLYWTKRKLVVK